ncbi:hypothetical protein KC19_1G144400 [Ceratodon purpureus]|uniref:Secreted protein n=1 Tax=Ceratodon purpureus TaxID=3225 RepID=A0A8T0J618_CERPU|nr:hypothetical protein KC19_1G144400 [Ceratodon purpureus]
MWWWLRAGHVCRCGCGCRCCVSFGWGSNGACADGATSSPPPPSSSHEYVSHAQFSEWGIIIQTSVRSAVHAATFKVWPSSQKEQERI